MAITGYTKTQSDAIFSPMVARRSQLVSVANRAQMTGALGSAQLSNGTDTVTTYQNQHVILATANGLRLRFGNTYNNSGAEADGPNAITVTASFWTRLSGIGDERFPVTFNGGNASVTIQPGFWVESDEIAVDVVKGQLTYSRSCVTVTSGQKWPIGLMLRGSNNYEGSVVGSDVTGTGTGITAFTNTTVQSYGPAAVLGRMALSPNASVISIMGDSIAAGSGDGYTGSTQDQGYILRSLGTNYAYLRVAMGSDSTNHWYTQSTCRRLAYQIGAPTHMIWEHGVNSRNSTLQQYSAAIWLRYFYRGIKIIATTITPSTTSTDSWATTGNQTIASSTGESYRVPYNNWLRGGAPLDPAALTPVAVGTSGAIVIGNAAHPLVGYYEIADLAETARDSGIWKANYTADGTHPNGTGAAALAPGVTLSYFTARA